VAELHLGHLLFCPYPADLFPKPAAYIL
jgi:hypothetical protein